MSIFTSPPTTTKYSFRHGDRHLGVWALQRFFNSLGYDHQVEDGVFGDKTEAAVRRYQKSTEATVDGIVGPQTQSRIVRSCIVRATVGPSLPKGLAEGQIDAESGRLIAAVNAQVPGGLDLGLTQRRCYGPPFDAAAVQNAMDPVKNVERSTSALFSNYSMFAARAGSGGEYIWRLAALAHNWPYAADLLSKGGTLSTTKTATWASNAKFADGVRVVTWRDWAEFYALGSHAHRHAGLVTGLAFGVPVR